MRHGKNLLKLSRKTKPRYRLLRNLVTSLLEHERIRTTQAKAKAMRKFADRMITLGKKTHLTPERKRVLLGAFLYSNVAIDKVVNELVPRFINTNGNYTKLRKDGCRRGDGARMAIIQYKENPYDLYEQQLKESAPTAKLPEFTLRILREEKTAFQSILETLEDTTKKPFFERQIARVDQEIIFHEERAKKFK